jgi:FkbM family methyltransferase
MPSLRDFLRWLTPHGLVERHRRRFRLGGLGLPARQDIEEAVAACRYDLWPATLRQPEAPWVLVDVGANEGEFFAAAAKLANLSAVHAFEPQPGCEVKLRCALAAVPGGHLHAVAVGARSGEIELFCTANSKMASVLQPDTAVAGEYAAGDFDAGRKLKVPMVRLDDVIPAGTPIGLLKIDVQGYELEVLEGARKTLESTAALLMELNYVPHYKGGVTFDPLCECLRKLGFQTFGISAPYGGNDRPLWADGLFVRSPITPAE